MQFSLNADPEVRHNAAHVAPAGLASAVSANDPELRYRAAKALANIADPSTTSVIIGILSSPDAELRKDAVEALGKIKSAPAVQAITKALNDRDPEVRKAAAEALGEIDEG